MCHCVCQAQTIQMFACYDGTTHTITVSADAVQGPSTELFTSFNVETSDNLKLHIPWSSARHLPSVKLIRWTVLEISWRTDKQFPCFMIE